MGDTTHSASGSDYWIFEGELLVELRNRMEAADFEDKIA